MIARESERQVTAITVSDDKEAANTFQMQEIKKNNMTNNNKKEKDHQTCELCYHLPDKEAER